MTTYQLPPEQAARLARDVIARSLKDPAFRQRLLADPAGTLDGAGITLPAGHTVRVVQNDAACSYIVIPLAPAGLSDEVLDSVAGGWGHPDACGCGPGPCGSCL
jgi:hypothetical protein